ncbi:hypothetical protein T439DRAFT_350076 [Meredithblackwellia eburnea MCA 4105]
MSEYYSNSNIHARNQSNSFRIAISSSSASSNASTSHPSSTSRKYPDSPRNLRKRPLHAHGSTGQSPFRQLTSVLGRLIRKWGPTLALALVGLLLVRIILTKLFTGFGYSRRHKESWEDDEVPKVERSALEKLRLLDIYFGADEDDQDGLGGDRIPEEVKRPAPGARKGGIDQPPVVAYIPDAIRLDTNSATARLPRVPADILDLDTCGTPRCSFLFPAWLGEQETKAQQHLYQLGLLAVALNRTLVLPHVAKSRLSACYRNPFTFYYSPDSLSRLGIPTISQLDFLEWAERRDPAPEAQVVSMVSAKQDYTAGAIEIDSASDATAVPGKPSRNLCLKPPRGRLDFSTRSPLALYPPEGYHRSESGRLGYGESVVNTLSSAEVGAKSLRIGLGGGMSYEPPEVLAFNFELRFPIMAPSVVEIFNPPPTQDPNDGAYDELPASTTPLPFSHFEYSSTWNELASSIASHLSPFIAIHWRTETLPPTNLAPCASSLVKKILAVKSKYPQIKNIYLATDYPIEDPSAAHSGTFAKVVTEQHHAAFRTFLKEVEKKLVKGKGMKLTSYVNVEGEVQVPEGLKEALASASTTSPDGVVTGPNSLAELDAGLMGIVDKAVAMRAEIFLSGFPGVGKEATNGCAKVSSFTNQIIEARERRWSAQEEVGIGEMELGEGMMWNKVGRWSVKGDVEEEEGTKV